MVHWGRRRWESFPEVGEVGYHECMLQLLSTLALVALCACSGSGTNDDAGGNDADVPRDGDQVGMDGDVDVDATTDADADGSVDADELADAEFDADEIEAICDDSVEPPLIESAHLDVGDTVEGLLLERCTEHLVTFTAALGSRVEVTVVPRGMYPIEAAITYPDSLDWSLPLQRMRADHVGLPESVELTPSRSGEYALLLRTTAEEVSQRYDVTVRCLDGCDFEATRYPIVMVHGWTGWNEIGSYEYFYNVPEALEDLGFNITVAELDPYNSIEVRSEQLAPQVDEVLRAARARKVNIIAHSQGGLDSRRLISTLGYGDRVSTLLTFATPHQGTPLLDVAMGLLPGPGEEALYFLLELLGASIVGSESDAEASFMAMTQDNVQNNFNPSNPDDPRVTYISWMGRTCLYGVSCDDICDIEIRWSYDIIYLVEGANDGIVPVSSAPWGDYRGEVPADHFDEIGQLAGVTNPNFDHIEFYIERARDLAAEGH